MGYAQLLGRELAVPGSTANLGPGFDAVALALRVYVRAQITRVDPTRSNALACTFCGIQLQGEDLIARSFAAAAAQLGRDAPATSVNVESDIPLKAGLGSSAAAIVLGLRVYEAVTGPVATADLLRMAADLEGHPDNTSASLLGGLVVSCRAAGGDVIAIASPWPDAIKVVVATPHAALETRRARQVLPGTVPLEDAVFNVQRAMLLVQSLGGPDRSALGEALRDRLHQPYRLPLVPGFEEALAFDSPTLIGVYLSGAGPSIAALVDGDPVPIVAEFDRLYTRLGLEHAVRVLDVHAPEAPAAADR